MLVVDKNIEVSMREQTEWLKHGISTVRVSSMQEAIEKLTKEPFLFTAINADNVNYLPLLKTMGETALTFIFIIDTNYTTEKEVIALHNGADVYTKFNSNVELNVRLALAQLLPCNERDKQPKLPTGMIIYDGFLVSATSHQIFCNDVNIKLTKKEYDLLY
jgi:DNA-binding response OmpR family regulator